jgi:microcystin-dependent protein
MKKILFISMLLVSLSADWNKPALTDTYSNFLLFLNNKISDSALWLDSVKTSPTNIPADAKRYNSANNTFQRYSGTTWVPIKTNIVGNVTGDLTGSVVGNMTGDLSGSADMLDGQHGAFYQNASNLNAGTVPLAQIPATLTGKDADTLDGQHGVYYAPPGSVIYMATAACPSGYLAANGTAVNRTTYSALFSSIGTVFGVGNGSTTFNLPDLRGEFIRGLDSSRGVDSGRALGSAQADDFKGHTHSNAVASTGLNAASGINYGVVSGGGTSGATGGTETRPRNVALLTCIHI